MGITKTRDGRYLVGQGVTDGNEYKGSLAWRDIVIQLSADGATAESIEKLEFLRDYGLYHSGEGNSVMPPSVSVWISNNGTTTAVEADDITVDGSNYTICGIKWNGSTWDFSQAGQGKSGSGLPPYTSADKGKTLTLGEGEGEPIVVVPEQTVTLPSGKSTASLSGVPTLEEAPESINYVFVYMGETFSGVAEKDANLRYHLGEMPLYLSLGHDGIFFLKILQAAPIDITVTISATISTPLVEPKWEGVHKVVEASETYTNGVAQMMTAAITEILTSGGTKTASEQYSNQIVTDEDAAAIENMCENWSKTPATFHVMGDYFTPVVVTSEAVQTNIPCYGYNANNVAYFFSVKIITNARTKSVTMLVVLDHYSGGGGQT